MRLFSERTNVIIKFILGILQMSGAIAALVLMIRTGINTTSVGVAVVTGILTSISVVLFGARSSAPPPGLRKRKDDVPKN
jgi:hypothetical protein